MVVFGKRECIDVKGGPNAGEIKRKKLIVG